MTEDKAKALIGVLNEFLSKHDDEDLFRAVWAIRAIQTGREAYCGTLLHYPAEAVTSNLGSEYSIFPWICETLLNEVLSNDRYDLIKIACRDYGSLRYAASLLFHIEEEEDDYIIQKINNNKTDVFRLLSRIANRQFGWQEGYVNMPSLYRSLYVYNGSESNRYFYDMTGISISRYMLYCAILVAIFNTRPTIYMSVDLHQIINELRIFGVNEIEFMTVINRLSLPHSKAKREAHNNRNIITQMAYKKSILRVYPCVIFGEGRRLMCPFPELLMERVTTGLFYDFMAAGGNVKKEKGEKFEEYCTALIKKAMPEMNISRGFRYSITKSESYDSPDIICRDGNNIAAIIECKARRAKYDVLFYDEPNENVLAEYNDIVYAIVQIWRFCHHCSVMAIKDRIKKNAVGVVLTMDNWMQQSGSNTIDKLSNDARQILLDKYGISSNDDDQIIPIVFADIQDVEILASKARNDNFLETLSYASNKEYQGWDLNRVFDNAIGSVGERRGYPFSDNISEILPWWGHFASLKSKS